MCDDEKAFLQTLLDSPEDEAIRLIYADWLDDHNREIQANWLRLESFAQQKIRTGVDCNSEFEQMRNLFIKVDPEWRGLVSRGKIQNCRAYTLPCPEVWQTLQPPDMFECEQQHSTLTRRCEACEREIYLVLSQTEAQARLWVDQLITIPVCLSLDKNDLEPDSASMTIEMQALEQRQDRPTSIGRKMQKRARRRYDS